jgi:hypothetical protein
MRGFDLVLTNGKILDGQGNTYRLVARASSEAWLRPIVLRWLVPPAPAVVYWVLREMIAPGAGDNRLEIG